jgi:glucose/arabinose dehydrogenase
MRKYAFAVALLASCALGASAADLKSYDSSKPSFWSHPPPDWFLGDETESMKGLAPQAGPALPTPMAELQDNLKKITLPPGFTIEVYASGIPDARQMAWGDNGTLFVGSRAAGTVTAVTDQDGKRTAKVILKGLTMPSGIAFRDGTLYVVAVNRLLRYDNAEANLDHMPAPVVAYDDMPPYLPHGWKYLVADKDGNMYIPFGPPFNIGIPPTSVAQIRRVDPKTGLAEIVALGVRNSVGGDIDPRTGDYWFTENARDWMSDDLPSDKLRTATRVTCRTRSSTAVTRARSSRRRCSILGRTWRRWG